MARRAFIVLLLAAALVPFQSVFRTDQIRPAPKLALAALAILSAVRPRHGLLVVAALGPFGNLLADPIGIGDALAPAPAPPAQAAVSNLHPLPTHQHRFAEALFLAFLIGHACRRLWRRGAGGPVPPSLLAPACLFGTVVLTSYAVNYAVWRSWDLAFPSGDRLVDFLVLGYQDSIDVSRLAPADPFDSLQATVLTCAGLAVLLVTCSLCRGDAGFVRRLVRMIVAGAAGAAALSFVALALYVANHPDATGLRTALLHRWTMFASINTGAPLLVLAAPLALATAWRTRTNRAVWWTAAAVLPGALYLNGTRTAILAGIFVAGAGALRMAHQRGGARALAATIAGIVAAGAVAAAITANRYADARHFFFSSRARVAIADEAAQLVAGEPAFGHGIGQYAREARRRDMQRNPHNHYLLVAAELGVVGAGVFVWLLAAIAWPMAKGLRSRPSDLLLFAACAGVAAYLLANAGRSSLGSAVGSFPFWIVAGLGAARSLDHGAQSAGAGAGTVTTAPTWPGRLRAGVILGVVLLTATVPWRIDRRTQRLDAEGVVRGVHGLAAWETAQGSRYRWTVGRTTFLLHESVTTLELPVRAGSVALTGPRRVRIRIDGVLVRQVDLAHDAWQAVRVIAPPARRAWRLVELEVHPTWRVADQFPETRDFRELGVMVGELQPNVHLADAGVGDLPYGVHAWELENGVRYRWTRGRARFFFHRDVTAVEMPMRAAGVAATGPRRVDVRVDGAFAHRRELTHDAWESVRIVLTPFDAPWRTLELEVDPTWTTRDALPHKTDTRELGVMLGAPRWCRGPVTKDGDCRNGWRSRDTPRSASRGRADPR